MIKNFIKKLTNTKVAKDARNPWDFSRKENAVRRKNLEGYLNAMRKARPSTLLIGEAPGYRGCGRVGVPFSSEKVILSHSFFSNRNIFDIENKELPMAEASATIVWKTFDSLQFYPLMWASFPFHPHKPGDPMSNRAPRAEETELGKKFIDELARIFKTRGFIAVGRKAEQTLAEMGYKAFAVRHPSHGGAKMFARGLREYVTSSRS